MQHQSLLIGEGRNTLYWSMFCLSLWHVMCSAKSGDNVGSCHLGLLLVTICFWNKTVDMVDTLYHFIKLLTCDMLQALVPNQTSLGV
jgi:hypothetical protein